MDALQIKRIIKVLVAPRGKTKRLSRLDVGKQAILTGKDYHCTVNEKQNPKQSHHWWAQKSTFYLLICSAGSKRSQGWSLISFRLYVSQRGRPHTWTYAALQHVWARFPSRKWQPCKRLSCNNELPAIWLHHREILSLLPRVGAVFRRDCVYVCVRTCVKYVREAEIKTAERLRWLLSLRGRALRQNWCRRSVAQQHTALTYVCMYVRSPTHT